jgi:hypothetical protein
MSSLCIDDADTLAAGAHNSVAFVIKSATARERLPAARPLCSAVMM